MTSHKKSNEDEFQKRNRREKGEIGLRFKRNLGIQEENGKGMRKSGGGIRGMVVVIKKKKKKKKTTILSPIFHSHHFLLVCFFFETKRTKTFEPHSGQDSERSSFFQKIIYGKICHINSYRSTSPPKQASTTSPLFFVLSIVKILNGKNKIRRKTEKKKNKNNDDTRKKKRNEFFGLFWILFLVFVTVVRFYKSK